MLFTSLGSACTSDGGGKNADAGVDAALPPNKLGLSVLASEFLSGVAAYGSVAVNDRLDVASGKAGLSTFSIGPAGALTPLGSLALDGNCLAVAVSGNTALLACGEAGVQAVDVSDPAKPRLARTVAYGQNITRDTVDVKIQGDVGFALDRKLGIHLLRPVSQPDKIAEYAQTDITALDLAAGSGLEVQPSAIYVSDTTKGLHILSYTIPESPHLEEVVPFSGGGARSVTVADGKAYCATHQLGLAIVELGGKPPAKTSFLDSPGDAMHVAVSGGQAYIADDGPDGPRLVVAKLDDPAGPSTLTLLPLGGQPRHVTLYKSYAFVSASGGGLYTVDISTPNAPKVSAQRTGEGKAQAVALLDKLALVAAGKGGLYIVDTSSPKAPVVLGTYLPDHGDAQDVTVNEGRVYVQTAVGLHILDVADPRNPKLLGAYLDASKTNAAVAVQDGTAYLCGFGSSAPGLDIVDVRDPQAPARLGVLWNEVSGNTVAVDRGFAYVGRGKLYVVDVSDPAAPKLSTTIGEDAGALHISGQYLWAGSGNGGALVAYDLSKPGKPVAGPSFKTNLSGVGGIVVEGQRLYASAGGGTEGLPGLQVLDLDRLFALMPGALISSVPTPGRAEGHWEIARDAKRDLTFIADGSAGLTIVGVP